MRGYSTRFADEVSNNLEFVVTAQSANLASTRNRCRGTRCGRRTLKESAAPDRRRHPPNHHYPQSRHQCGRPAHPRGHPLDGAARRQSRHIPSELPGGRWARIDLANAGFLFLNDAILPEMPKSGMVDEIGQECCPICQPDGGVGIYRMAACRASMRTLCFFMTVGADWGVSEGTAPLDTSGTRSGW